MMLHVEALVYRGDLEYEANQKKKSYPPDDAWRSGIEEVLDSHGLNDHRLRKELEELNRYFRDETRIMLSDPRDVEDLVVETWHRRSSDLRLLARLAYLLTRRSGCEDFIQSSRPFMVLSETLADLISHKKDVEEDGFNILRFFSWVHGIDQGKQKFETWARSAIRDCINEMHSLPKGMLIARYMMIVRYRTQLSSRDAAVGSKLERHLTRLAHLLPQKLVLLLAVRQFKSVGDNLDAAIPQIMKSPRGTRADLSKHRRMAIRHPYHHQYPIDQK